MNWSTVEVWGATFTVQSLIGTSVPSVENAHVRTTVNRNRFRTPSRLGRRP